MSRTIGKHWPRRLRLTGSGCCDICGVRYSMDKLRKNGDGFWACFGPGTNNDLRGRTMTEISAKQAHAALEITGDDLKREMAAFDKGIDR